MSDSDIPDKFGPAIHWVLAGIALFVFFLIAAEQFVQREYDSATVFSILFFVTLVVAVKWNIILNSIKREGLKYVALAIIVISVIGLAFGVYLLSSKPMTETVTAHTAASVELNQSQVALAKSVSLRLLLRPNQDPLELNRDNIWRWFVFKTVNKNPITKETHVIGTYFFLVFDRPVSPAYRRVYSSSNPNLRFDVLDLSPRSMITLVNDVELDGQTIEIQVSDSPL